MIGAGTLGLLTVAALRRCGRARHDLAGRRQAPAPAAAGPPSSAADTADLLRRPTSSPGPCAAPSGTAWSTRRRRHERLTGAPTSRIDCVGSAEQPRPRPSAVTRPGGRVVLVGHARPRARSTSPRCGSGRSPSPGAYAYGTETLAGHAVPHLRPGLRAGRRRRPRPARVSATYPLSRATPTRSTTPPTPAAAAPRKIAFDLPAATRPDHPATRTLKGDVEPTTDLPAPPRPPERRPAPRPVRARRRPLDPADPVPPRRAVPPRAPARRTAAASSTRRSRCTARGPRRGHPRRARSTRIDCEPLPRPAVRRA